MSENGIERNKPEQIIIRLLALFLVLWVGWRMLTAGLAEHYLREVEMGNHAALDSALFWNPDQPKMLYLKARQLRADAPEKAAELLRKAMRQNPADAHVVQLLAELMLESGAQQEADRLMNLSVDLMPSDIDVRLRAARYWAGRERLDLALNNWSMALTLDSDQGKVLFPVLLKIAENKELVGLFKSLAKAPPLWWDAFYEHVANQARRLDTVLTLATIRHASGVKLSSSERRLLGERLMKAGAWGEAFLVWSNGLSSEQRQYLGSVFDGGFELPPDNKGFGWHFPEDRGWLIRRKHTYGAEGEKALHILYKGRSVPVYQIYQPLLLMPGSYVMRMLSRVDRLHTQGGLRWVVRCLGDEKRILGLGPLLVGASDWGTREFRFSVPDERSCSAQLLRLELSDVETGKQVIDGEVWFDRLVIRKLQ